MEHRIYKFPLRLTFTTEDPEFELKFKVPPVISMLPSIFTIFVLPVLDWHLTVPLLINKSPLTVMVGEALENSNTELAFIIIFPPMLVLTELLPPILINWEFELVMVMFPWDKLLLVVVFIKFQVFDKALAFISIFPKAAVNPL